MHSKFETKTVNGISLLNEETGELTEFKAKAKVSYDDFMLVFLSTVTEMYKLKGAELKVLLVCWKESTFNAKDSLDGNQFSNDRYFKDKVRASGLDLTDSAIDVYISRLTKTGLVVKVCRGRYMLNPKYFFKGKQTDASKLVLTLEAR